MNLQQRIELFTALGTYLKKEPESWLNAKARASAANPWFTPEFIDLSIKNIIEQYLREDKLKAWAGAYGTMEPAQPRLVGVVMAGNIPLVGFHDLLSVIISGHRLMIKPSSRDEVLMRFIVETLHTMSPSLEKDVQISDTLKGCDAYIATGSNQSARYFDYYFARFPHIIRSNKTSVAILTGNETEKELDLLADDVHLFFGLGCRNVTKIYVPPAYDFIPLLRAFDAYAGLKDMHKYANNFDYQLSLILLNKQAYMTNGSTLLIEHPALFSAIGVLHYEHYTNRTELLQGLQQNESVQCIVGEGHIPFGEAQKPGLTNYADGVDTMQFLAGLS